MKCKNCNRTIEDNSIFCNWCGERQLRQRRKASVTVPKPRLLPSGLWHIELRKERAYFTDPDPDVCTQKAVAYRTRWLHDPSIRTDNQKVLSLSEAIDLYISSKDNILSPATVKAYRSYRQHRLQNCMGWNIYDPSLNWQMAINDELESISPKTVFNAWHLITAAINFSGAPAPKVSLPRIPRRERPWLSYEQITLFLDAIRDEPGELGALLALHSLRLSELLALKPSNVIARSETLLIRGSRVLNSQGQLTFKELNKTDASQRDVPIVIPRLLELLKRVDPNQPWVYSGSPHSLYFQVNRACERAGVPKVGVHGLRHSFASLAYHLGWKEMSTMQVGGWSNSRIVHEIYTHNADLQKDVKTMKDYYQNNI